MTDWSDTLGMDAFSALVTGFAGALATEEPAGGLYLDELVIDLPVELHIANGADGVAVLAAPVRQKTATSIMPVMHRLRLTVKLEEDADA